MTTTLTELRQALNDIKAESGSGSKQRKQDRFKEGYDTNVGHLVIGERYDAAGVGPSTAREAAEEAFGEVADGATLSESLASMDVGGDKESAALLVDDLDQLADLSGNEQKNRLAATFAKYSQPSLVSLALLGDESFGLGTSQMRQIWFDGTRSERKRAEALTGSTVEFINLAKQDELPDSPEVFRSFAPQLAKPESNLPEFVEE